MQVEKSSHKEEHLGSSAFITDIVIGMADGLTVPFALAAGLSGAVHSGKEQCSYYWHLLYYRWFNSAVSIFFYQNSSSGIIYFCITDDSLPLLFRIF